MTRQRRNEPAWARQDQPTRNASTVAASRVGLAIPWQVRLLLLAAIWGSSFMFIKVGDEALAPLQVTLGRMLCGTVALFLILATRRERLPREPHVWGHLAVAAFLLNVLPFSLLAYGETQTTSVLAGILNATSALFTLLVAMAALPEERLTANRACGLVLSFLGVLIVFGVWHGLGGHAWRGNIAILGAAVSYGFGFPYARKHLAGRPESTVALATGQLLCGTVALALVIPFVTRTPASLPLHVVASVVTLGALGTGVAYILNYRLIRDAGATLAATVVYLIPLFSTVEGAIVLGEPLTWYEPVGAAVVILGIAAAQGRLRVAARPSHDVHCKRSIQ